MLKPKFKSILSCGLHLACLLLCSLKLWSQNTDCPSEPQFDVPGNVLRIQGIWKGATSSYIESLNIRSVSGGRYSIKIGKLVQAQSRQVVMGKKISISDSILLIPTNGQQSIEVQASNLGEAGLYETMLEISATGTSSCKWRLPLRLELHREKALKVLEADQNQTYKYVNKSWRWLNFLMPAGLLQHRIQVRIDNEEALPLRLDSFALALRGQGSGEQITQNALQLRGDQKQIAPRDLKTLQFDLVQMPPVADQYTGQLRLYFKEQSEPLLVNLVVYLRRGAGLAFLLLLLGVLLGRLIRYLNKVKEQMPLVGLYYRIAARAAKLRDVVARYEIEIKLQALEPKIEAAKKTEAIAAVQEELKQVEQQIEQLLHLELSIERIRENPDLKISDTPESEAKLNEHHFNIRDAVLELKPEEVKNGFIDLKGWVEHLKRIQGGGDKTAASEDSAQKLKEHLDKSAEAINAERRLPRSNAPIFSPFKRKMIYILGLLSGISINVQSAYLWGRPLVALFAFALLILLGYYDMYIKVGLTFGSEGLYDYLKLILWGALSDGVSQSLARSKELMGFLGKEKE